MRSAQSNSPVTGVLIMILIFSLVSSHRALAAQSNMPFNGPLAFHKISLTIPDDYIRDSTQSTEDFWIFEKGFYTQYIMLSRKDVQGNVRDMLDGYVKYLRSEGVQSQRISFLNLEAVHSEALQDDCAWREVVFVHDHSLYTVAMRGGTQKEMQALLDTVALHNETPDTVIQPDRRSGLERFFEYAFGD